MKTTSKGKKLFLSMICLCSLGMQAQQGNNWHFGNQAGINFNGPPVATTSAYYGAYSGVGATNEGVASISNNSGNTLFYTDGQTVYTNLNTAMPNGSGLLGNSSSTQSGIIIPKPGSLTQYYVFTVDAVSGTNTIKYNIVDMSLNSGLGDVITSKKNLSMPYALAAPVAFTEKLTAVPKVNGIGFWLIAHISKETGATGTFVIWEIGCGAANDGLSEFLVSGSRQNIGSPTTTIYANELGYMKVSPNYQKLAYANSGANFAEVFDFNNTTGILSNPKKVTTNTLGAGCLPYGVEFSPNNLFLYIGDLYHGPKIIRYDLTQAVLDIPSSCVVFDATYTTSGSSLNQTGAFLGSWPSFYTLGSLQYAPDGNIYGALPGKDHLLKIMTPNATFPQILENGFALGSGKYSAAGLPNFTSATFANAQITIIGAPCSYSLSYAGASNIPGGTYSWTFGDGTSSTLQNPTHAYGSAGTFTVTLVVTDPSTGCSAIAQQTLQTTGCSCLASTDPMYVKYLSNTTISSNTTWGAKIYIADNIIVTVDNGATLDITNVDVVLGHGAGIDFKNGAVIRANNSVFRPCFINEVWRGLDFYTTNATPPLGTINECTFKNAKTALEGYSSAGKLALDLRITNNLFADCQRGIALSATTFNRAISGNTYMMDNKNLPYNTVSSALNSASALDFYGIYSTNNTYTDLITQNDFAFTSSASLNNARVCGIFASSDANLSVSDNKFTDFSIGIYANSTTNMSIENNSFTWSHLFTMSSSTNNVQILANYAQNALIKGNKIYNSNVLNSTAPTLPSLSTANIGISSNGSRYVIVSQNEIEGCEIGMSFTGINRQGNQYLFITENDIKKAWYFGIYVSSYIDTDISCNKIDMELNSTRDVTGISYNNLLLGSGADGYYLNAVNVGIRSNCVSNTKNGIYCYNQNNTVAIALPKVYNNFVYNYLKFGFENNGFSALAASSPREVYHNSFISNNSATGTMDINTDAAHIINLEANFGVQNLNPNVTMISANTQASSASCALQVSSFKNDLNIYKGAQLCTYYFAGSWAPVAKMIPMVNLQPLADSTDYFGNGVYVIEPIHTEGLQTVNYKDELFQVYPNPAKDKVTIYYTIDGIDHAYLEFIDVQGKVVKTQHLTYDMINMPVDIADLPHGFYILRMTNSEKSMHYAKLVKD